MRKFVTFALVAFGVGAMAGDASAFGKRKKNKGGCDAAPVAPCGCDGGYGYPTGGYPGTSHYGTTYPGTSHYGTGYSGGYGYQPSYYPAAGRPTPLMTR